MQHSTRRHDMNVPGKRSRLAASAAAVAIAGGVGLGVAGAIATGADMTPWSTTHGRAVTVDVADGGKVTPQPFVITKKVDVPSPVMF
jgi:hypothetical protein